MTDEEVIEQFHVMWDGFPGMARLIRRDHVVLAANVAAERKGFSCGAICAKVGDPAIHRRCKLGVLFAEGNPQSDNVLPDRVRGWVPVRGRDDLCVHFAVMIPEEG